MRGLTARLLIFNLLLAFFPVGAMLVLGTYETQLLESQEQAMVQQGRLLASALSGTDLAVEAKMVLDRLGARTDARLRVVDGGGRLLADSARPIPPEDKTKESNAFLNQKNISVTPPEEENNIASKDSTAASYPEESLIYRIGALPARTIRTITAFIRPPSAPKAEAEYYIGQKVLDGPEIQAALDGRYGAATRISQGQISVTLYSAIPIIRDEKPIGAVLISRSTFAILNDLYQLRLDIMNIFLLSIGVAVILSILLARTVTVPVGRLRNQAEGLLDERGKLRARFNPISGKDEVADLSKALYHLSSRLQERTDHLEDFIADLVHEMKNPVAGILSAAELAEENTQNETQRFIDVINREGRRIQRLLDDLQELISVDLRLDKGQQYPVEIAEFLKRLVSSYLQHKRNDVDVNFVNNHGKEIFVNVDPDRLAQASLNLIDNAVSFSPYGGCVELCLNADDSTVSIRVSDQGPGISELDCEKIFERWYTDRPAAESTDHTGLGLAIVRGIAEGYGGRVYLKPKNKNGSDFVLEFPKDSSV